MYDGAFLLKAVKYFRNKAMFDIVLNSPLKDAVSSDTTDLPQKCYLVFYAGGKKFISFVVWF